jgi:thiol-disulfide isomerase/thioredoxin
MVSITLGPLAFPLPPLLVLGGLLLALVLARFMAARRQTGEARPEAASRAESAVWLAGLLGLASARAAHVLTNLDVYADTPLAMLDFRDGGWMPWPGVAVGVAVLAWRGARWPAGRQALAAGGAAGLLAWATAGALLRPAETPQSMAAAAAVPLTALATATGSAPLPLAALQDGRPLVVNLWATWCAPCREEMPVFAEAQRRHPEVRFLMVNQGESAAIVQRYLARENLTLQDVFLDPTSALGPAVGSRGLPTTLFLDAQGRRVHAHMGALNAAALATQVRRLQAASN